MHGTVLRFENRCGFVKPDDGSKDLFLHESNVVDDVALRVNNRISFDVGAPVKGARPIARNVRKLAAPTYEYVKPAPRENYLDSYRTYAATVNPTVPTKFSHTEDFI